MKTVKTISVDDLLWQTATKMISDFQTYVSDVKLQDLACICIRQDVAALRTFDWPTVSDPYLFKVWAQMEGLFKRHRFAKDLYADDQLKCEAWSKFVAIQDELRVLDFESKMEDPVFAVLIGYAKTFIRRTLGAYHVEEHVASCKFGKRASYGIPSKLACEAERWVAPFSGTETQFAWFVENVFSTDLRQAEYYLSQCTKDGTIPLYNAPEALNFTLVPKSFKAFRSIIPNTTLGSYMTHGLGRMIERRLRRKGYDIKTLQHEHRDLAMLGSIHGTLCTMDLSSASDRLSVDLVRALLPEEWFSALMQARVPGIKYKEDLLPNPSTFCTMGVGFTFPLQTLCFLSLIHAVSRYRYHEGFDIYRGVISVYGDDMIFDSIMYKSVMLFLHQCGLVVNVDKTFATGGFRESCGGDYYCGLDVRPYQPKYGASEVQRKETFEAILYKTINGLLCRWSCYELPGTLAYLSQRLREVVLSPKIVPHDFPDDAGIQSVDPRSMPIPWHGCVKWPKSIGHGLFRISYLRMKSTLRKENRHEPYYWLSISGIPDERADDPLIGAPMDRRGRLSTVLEAALCAAAAPKHGLRTVRVRTPGSSKIAPQMETVTTVGRTGFHMRKNGQVSFTSPRPAQSSLLWSLRL